MGHRGEEHIARAVAQAIVDNLEAIDIEKEHREVVARIAPSPRHTVREAIDEEISIRQAREGVVKRAEHQLLLGAPNHIYHGGLLHTSVRYFDPGRQRSGLPPDVAALVDRLTPEGFRIRLVNLHPTESRDVVLQAGMFGEHDFTHVRQIDHYPYQFYTVDGPAFRIRLIPGAVGQLMIDLDRFVNSPTYAFPPMDP